MGKIWWDTFGSSRLDMSIFVAVPTFMGNYDLEKISPCILDFWSWMEHSDWCKAVGKEGRLLMYSFIAYFAWTVDTFG